MNLEAEAAVVLALEGEREAARAHASDPADDVMFKIVNEACLKGERAHRLASETVDIQVFHC